MCVLYVHGCLSDLVSAEGIHDIRPFLAVWHYVRDCHERWGFRVHNNITESPDWIPSLSLLDYFTTPFLTQLQFARRMTVQETVAQAVSEQHLLSRTLGSISISDKTYNRKISLIFKPTSMDVKIFILLCNMMAWQWAETLVEIGGTLADIRGTTE